MKRVSRNMDNEETTIVENQITAFPRFVQYIMHAGSHVGEYRYGIVISERDNDLVDLLIFLHPEDGQGKLIDFVQAVSGDKPGQYLH